MENAKKEVEKIAKLAALDLSDAEKTLYAKQFSGILEWAELIQETDTDNIECFSHSIKNKRLREDKENKFDNAKGLLENAPEKEGNFIKVKKVMRDKKDHEARKIRN